MRELWGHRDARLIVIGQGVSAFGDWLLLLVLGIWVKELTGSNGAAGATILAVLAPGVLAPFVGLLVDRFPRRSVLVGNDLLSALALVPLVAVDSRDDVWIIYLVAVSYGISQIVLGSAVSALVQEALPEHLLGPTNGVLATLRQSMQMIGPLTGAALYAVGGIGPVVLLDIATFLFSAVTFALVRAGRRRPGAGEPSAQAGAAGEAGAGDEERLSRQIAGGWRFASTDVVLRPVLLATTLGLLLVGLLEPAIFGLVEAFGHPPTYVGLLSGLQGAGAIVGGVIVSSLLARRNQVRVLAVAMLGAAVAMATAAVPLWTAVVAAVVVAGGFVVAFEVAFATTLQVRTPPQLMGRVAALANVLLTVPQSLAVALGAALVDLTGYAPLVIASAVTLFAGGLVALRAPADVADVAGVDDVPDDLSGVAGQRDG